MAADIEDHDLVRFEAHGAGPLPAADTEGWLDYDGARIWHASYGHGPPVVLLHGGLGHACNWGYQVPALLSAGYRAIVIDSRALPAGATVRASRWWWPSARQPVPQACSSSHATWIRAARRRWSRAP